MSWWEAATVTVNGSVCDLLPQLGASLDETVTERDLDDLLWVFGCESSAVCTISHPGPCLQIFNRFKYQWGGIVCISRS